VNASLSYHFVHDLTKLAFHLAVEGLSELILRRELEIRQSWSRRTRLNANDVIYVYALYLVRCSVAGQHFVCADHHEVSVGSRSFVGSS